MRKYSVYLSILWISLFTFITACGTGNVTNPEDWGVLNSDEAIANATAAIEATATAAYAAVTPETPQMNNEDSEEEPQTDASAANFDGETLTLATTTSTYDSGLLDFIIPDFEVQTGAEVEIISVGTGAAIELGKNGDVDVILVHSRSREDAFVTAGHGTARFDVMYNDFIIIGSEDDPAGIAGMSATEAFAQIASEEAPFISRGDDSGTHSKERAIWMSADIEPTGDWYQEAGQGMGAVLTITDEQQAYTLTDRGTYLARLSEGIDLVVLVEGDEILFNPYGVIPVNPEKSDEINGDLTTAFVEWLTSVETQIMIGSFELNDSPLFTPNSEAFLESQ